MLAKISSDRLSVHAVWMPVLGLDDEPSARESRSLLSDPRVKHYWTGEQDLGMAYGQVVTLPHGRDLAWDIYFAYGPGVEWGDRPPEPDGWVHQLGMDDSHLGDGSGFRKIVEELIEQTTSSPLSSAPRGSRRLFGDCEKVLIHSPCRASRSTTSSMLRSAPSGPATQSS